jgi:hypothetical protein
VQTWSQIFFLKAARSRDPHQHFAPVRMVQDRNYRSHVRLSSGHGREKEMFQTVKQYI